jgi:ElaB/YqjD/DUF883 family membrane-anchored ribosome-binding protein
MESVTNDNGQGIRADAKMRMNDVGDASPELTVARNQEARQLIADTQDLLGRVAHLADPEINRLRSKLERGLAVAKRTLSDGTGRLQHHAKDVLSAGDGYVHDQPWQAMGIAAAAGVVVGFLAARR